MRTPCNFNIRSLRERKCLLKQKAKSPHHSSVVALRLAAFVVVVGRCIGALVANARLSVSAAHITIGIDAAIVISVIVVVAYKTKKSEMHKLCALGDANSRERGDLHPFSPPLRESV